MRPITFSLKAPHTDCFAMKPHCAYSSRGRCKKGKLMELEDSFHTQTQTALFDQPSVLACCMSSLCQDWSHPTVNGTKCWGVPSDENGQKRIPASFLAFASSRSLARSHAPTPHTTNSDLRSLSRDSREHVAVVFCFM